MKLTVLQEDLVEALSITSRFTSQKAQLPILGNILFSTEKNKLRLSATNLETSVSLCVGSQIENEGTTTVPSRILMDFISQIPKGKIQLESKKDILHINSSGYSSTIKGISASDFPEVPTQLQSKTLSLDANVLTNALQDVLFAVSSDETRPILTGVLFVFEKNNLSLVATDGFRLSKREVSVTSDMNQKIIVPKSILSELVKIDENKTLSISLPDKNNQILFEINDALYTSRIIQGDFPNYAKIIPSTNIFKVNVDKNDLLHAVKASGVFARDSSDVITVEIKNNALELKSESKHSGNQTALVDAKIETSNKKDTPLIAFNYRFMLDFLQNVRSDTVRIELSDEDSPGVFLDPKEKDFLHLIMPVKL